MDTLSLEEVELNKIQSIAEKYGYHAFLRFDAIHIRSTYESWFFVPNESGSIKLMHGNGVGMADKWHKQFTRSQMNYEDLIQYIHEHEQAKYTNKFVRYKYTKHGVPKNMLRKKRLQAG